MQKLLRTHKALVLRENLEFAQSALGWSGRLASLDFAAGETAASGIRNWDDLGRAYFRAALHKALPGGILYNLAASWYTAKKNYLCLAVLGILFWEKRFPCEDVQPHGKARANRYWLIGKAWVQAGFPRLGFRFLKKAVEIGGNFGQETFFIVRVARKLRKPEGEIKHYTVLALPYNHRYPTEFCFGKD